MCLGSVKGLTFQKLIPRLCVCLMEGVLLCLLQLIIDLTLDKMVDLTECPVGGCGSVCENNTLMMMHFTRVHKNDPTKKFHDVLCFYLECTHQPFNSVSSLYNHLQADHPEFKTSNTGREVHNQLSNLESCAIEAEPLLSLGSPNESSYSIHDEPVSQNCPTRGSDPLEQTNPGLLILTLLEEFKLTQVAVQSIIKLIQEITQHTVTSVMMSVIESVTTTLGEEAHLTLDGLQTCIENRDFDPFCSLKTRHLQRKFFTDNLGLIPPTAIPLPTETDELQRVRTDKPRAVKPQFVYYVPIIKVLQSLLSKDDVYAQVFNSSKQHSTETADILKSFEDGSHYKNSTFFKDHPKALQIHLYLDEAQQCVLGAKANNKHKLLFVYFTVGNLNSFSRSSFKNIHLVSIFRNSQVKRYGLKVLLRPVVNDLKLLEMGVEMRLKGGILRVFGTLAITTADNLGSHEIGGFKLGFSFAFRPCRHCLATADDIQTVYSDGDIPPRTIEQHTWACAQIGTDLEGHASRVYGVTEDSILNELEHFSVLTGLVPDAMHDILEGSLPVVVIELINYLLDKKCITLKTLNASIRNFKYGINEVKNKPCEIDAAHLKKKKLRQSAAQLWTLAILLPLMIGSQIPVTDTRWQCYTDFLEICRFIFCTSISQHQIRMLESMISEFLTNFRIAFPNKNLIPKMHFLIHYPRYIRMYGPLMAYWCMRYEAKHSYFKGLTRTIGNYKNLPLTLSFRHQQWQCMNFNSSKPYLSLHIDLPRFKEHFLSTFNCPGAVAQLFSLKKRTPIVLSHSWISIASTTISTQSTFLLCNLSGSDSKAFGLVSSILKIKNSFVFICEMYRTIQFDLHLQAYHVKPRPDHFFMPVLLEDVINNLVPYAVHNPVHVNLTVSNYESLYIVPRTEIKLKN